jgi:hypothetical protein
MANIYVEGKNLHGPQIKESLVPAAVAGYQRGLAVIYGSDSLHAALVAVAATLAIGILEEDAISTLNPCSVIEFGPAVAQIGANVTAQQALTTNAAGQLVPAQPGQPVVAIAQESQQYVAPGSFAGVLVVAALGIVLPGDAVTHWTVAGAIPIGTATHGIGSGAALAMTLAQPSAAQDGAKLFITAETAHAHTITTAAAGINGAKHVVTFTGQGDGVELEAVAGVWNVRSLVGAAALS